MVQHAKLSTTVYNPPSLPAYLASTHHLKAISGIPSDEDIKAIHAVIKAVNGISHIPGMHDPDLSIQLAKHLFDVQMAVYRGQYSFSPFPGDIVYTPPPLPSHIPVTLQPVIGAPSDEELKLVHNMVRAAESLANTSSVFDPDLSMKLSQHLFNINIARYIRDSMHGQLGSQVGDLPRSEQTSSQPDLPAPNSQLIPVARNQSCFVPSTICITNVPEGLSGQTKELNLHDAMIDIKNAQEEANHIMNEANETLKSINRTLVSTQLMLFLTHSYSGREVYFRANDRGELSTDHDLPSIDILNLNSHSDQTIARFLQFYSIGADLIEDGHDSEINIKPGMRKEAQKILRNHVVGI